MTAPNSTSDPTYKSPAYSEMEPGWTLVRDIRGGTDAIRAKRATYLPSFEAEHVNDYNARVGMTFAFDALDETIHAMVGIATRNDPVLEDDVPERIVLEWENVDGQRTHGAVFAQHVLEAAIQDGHCAILADFPPAPVGLTLADEQRLGFRAYAVLVTIDQITAWRVGVINGKQCLTMVKIAESVEQEDGDFGTAVVERFRIFRQQVDDEDNPFVTYEVLTKTGIENGVSTFTSSGIGTMRGPKWIPLFPVYGGEQTGILESKPPLRGLAYSNLDHTQVKSDRRYAMHKCAVPMPLFIGRTPTAEPADGQRRVGANWGFDVQLGGDFKWVGPSGTGLSDLRDELTDIEGRMGPQGFSMLKRDTKANKTATESQIEEAKGESKLSRAVRSLNDGLEGMVQAFADFYGLPEGGSVTLQREFADTVLEPEEMRILMELEQAGELTIGTLLGELQKGGRLLQGVDLDEEEEALKRQRAMEPTPPEPTPQPAPITVPAAA